MVRGEEEAGEDAFDGWFRVFSTEHSWYKTAKEEGYFVVPQNELDRPWTLHSWHIPKDIPIAVRAMIVDHTVPINGLIYGHHGHGHGLHILIGKGGYPFIGYLGKRYPKVAELLRKHCKDNSSNRDDRYKVIITDPKVYKDPLIKDLYSKEYHRMKRLAKDAFYRILQRLHPWLRDQFKSSTPEPLGELSSYAKLYASNLLTFSATLRSITVLPDELIALCQEFHNVF